MGRFEAENSSEGKIPNQWKLTLHKKWKMHFLMGSSSLKNRGSRGAGFSLQANTLAALRIKGGMNHRGSRSLIETSMNSADKDYGWMFPSKYTQSVNKLLHISERLYETAIGKAKKNGWHPLKLFI